MKFSITRKKIRNYLIFFWSCIALVFLGIYIYLIPALHIDFVTKAALHPDVKPTDSPVADTTLGVKAEPISIKVERNGQVINLSAVIYRRPGKQIMLYSHGNAGCIDNRFDNFRIGCALKENFSVLLYDYEGYGRSQGIADYRYLLDDARAAYKYVRSLGYEPKDIVLYGESLGGGVSTELARTEPVRALLLDCTFTSPERWAKYQVPAAHIYPGFFFPAPHYDNLDFISHKHPLCLVVSAAHDSSIPACHAQEMQNNAASDTIFLHLPASQHCYVDQADRPAFARAMSEFAAAVRAKPAERS